MIKLELIVRRFNSIFTLSPDLSRFISIYIHSPYDSNYRPIALATIVSKMFESVLLFKCAEYLSTSDNQFGFKSSHSTDLCIYTLKEFIDYYKSRGTTVYITFLDDSEAFDRIDHWLLFNKNIKKGVPLFIIK